MCLTTAVAVYMTSPVKASMRGAVTRGQSWTESQEAKICSKSYRWSQRQGVPGMTLLFWVSTMKSKPVVERMPKSGWCGDQDPVLCQNDLWHCGMFFVHWGTPRISCWLLDHLLWTNTINSSTKNRQFC